MKEQFIVYLLSKLYGKNTSNYMGYTQNNTAML